MLRIANRRLNQSASRQLHLGKQTHGRLHALDVALKWCVLQYHVSEQAAEDVLKRGKSVELLKQITLSVRVHPSRFSFYHSFIISLILGEDRVYKTNTLSS